MPPPAAPPGPVPGPPLGRDPEPRCSRCGLPIGTKPFYSDQPGVPQHAYLGDCPRVDPADERHAWDLYAAAVITVDDFEPSEAAAVADLLLSERRKRWGGAPEGGK